MRVPFAARWPGVIAPGSSSDEPAMTMDLMPTLMELAGSKPPSGVDGISIAAVLREGASLPARKLFWEMNGRMAMRDGDWKLLLLPERGTRSVAVELYNLAADRAESNNLAERHPERTRAMRNELQAWLADVRKGAVPQPLAPKQ